jgi:hypothetical protein
MTFGSFHEGRISIGNRLSEKYTVDISVDYVVKDKRKNTAYLYIGLAF